MTTVVYIYQDDNLVNQSIEALPSNVNVIAVKQTQGIPQTQLIKSEGRVEYYERSSLAFRFDEARNEAIKLVKTDWIIMLDQDEFLCATEAEIGGLDELPYDIGGLYFDIINPSVGPDGEVNTDVSRVVRAFRNAGFSYEFRAHEQIAPSIQAAGYKIAWYSIAIRHYGYYTDTYKDYVRLAIRKGRRNLDLNIRDYCEALTQERQEFLLSSIASTSSMLLKLGGIREYNR